MQLLNEPLKEISIQVKGTGFRIFAASLIDKTITLDASKFNKGKLSNYYILVDKELNTFKNQIQSGLEIQAIQNDTLFLNLGTLSSKKVAIKPDIQLNYHIGYDLIDNIVLNPDSVVVSGPEIKLKKLNDIKLKPLILNDVKEDFNATVEVKESYLKQGLKLKNRQVQISGKVDKFTEGSIKIPFLVKNVPDSIKITTLLEQIEIKYIVALSNFNKVSTNSLQIECDYATTKENNLSYLIPKLVYKPDFIKSYKIIPNKIDYLIRKK